MWGKWELPGEWDDEASRAGDERGGGEGRAVEAPPLPGAAPATAPTAALPVEPLPPPAVPAVAPATMLPRGWRGGSVLSRGG